MATKPVNHLSPNFSIVGGSYGMYQTMTTKEYRETLLATDGRWIARGEVWDIIGKRIGPGVYRVTLKLANLA